MTKVLVHKVIRNGDGNVVLCAAIDAIVDGSDPYKQRDFLRPS